jgi:putative tricarboxylic transport membrane protein
MLGFGIAGFVLRRLNYPMAPLVLGLVLGDLMEKNLRRGLVLSDGSIAPFFERPISLGMFLVIVAVVLWRVPAVRRLLPGGGRAARAV